MGEHSNVCSTGYSSHYRGPNSSVSLVFLSFWCFFSPPLSFPFALTLSRSPSLSAHTVTIWPASAVQASPQIPKEGSSGCCEILVCSVVAHSCEIPWLQKGGSPAQLNAMTSRIRPAVGARGLAAHAMNKTKTKAGNKTAHSQILVTKTPTRQGDDV